MRTPHTLLLVCTLSFAGPAALAASPETTVMTDKARKLFQEGNEALKRRKFLEAHASYLAAWALNPHWQIAANLADSELELGKNREAAEHATYYQKGAPGDRQAKASALLQRALARVVRLAINVDLAGAEVLVDGTSVGHAPLPAPIFVDPGPHQVTARFPERPDAVQSVSFTAGSAESISLALPPAPSPLPPPEANPTKPVQPTPAPPATSPTLPDPPPPPPVIEKRPLWPALAAGGVAVVALGVGAGLTVAAHSKSKDADTLGAQVGGSSACFGSQATSPSCAGLVDALSNKSKLSNGAFVAYLAGGVAAAGAVGLGIWAALPRKQPRDRRTQTTLRVLPSIGARDANVVLIGAW